MRRIAVAVSICCGLAPTNLHAFDWSIRASESETVELNSNQLLRSSPAGSVGSYSTLTTNVQAQTPTSRFNFDADGSYKKYWGPGVAGAATEFLNYGFRGRYEQYGKNRFDREFVESSWRQTSTSLALLNDLGVITPARGFLDRFTATGGIDRSLTARDTVNLFATSTRTSYQPSSGGTPFTDTLARANWRHALDGTRGFNFSSEGELLEYDNTFGTQIAIYRNQIGGDAALSSVLSFRGNIGAAYVVTERGVSTAAIGGTSTTTPRSNAVLDWIGDAVLTYKFMKTATLSITASQTVGPSVVGSLIKRDILSASVNYLVNSRENVTFSASGTRQIATSTTDFASFSATYAYNPIRDLSLQLTYRYQHRFASTGSTIVDPLTGTPTVSGTAPADSHGLLFVATHNFFVLPPGR